MTSLKTKILNKHFTPKQQQVLSQMINNDQWNLMINYGAVRSGKTVINNYGFVMSLLKVKRMADKQRVKDPLYILAGTSRKSIFNNVLNPLFNDFGLMPEQDAVGNIHLFGVTIVLAYTGTIAGLRGVRGSSAWGAYINEASLANEEVFNEIRDRCSEGEGRVICDTNPGIPTHWLKKNYIDSDSPLIISNHFVLEDNTFLSQRYIENKKQTTPKGMFYDRSILGLWVTGEGIVYSDFNKDTMIVNSVPDNLTYYVGVDWGFEHKNSITVWGEDEERNTYLLEEHTGKHKFIDYWVNVAKTIQQRYGQNIRFWCDSARPDNVTEFQANGINAINANKSVLPVIECVAQLMKTGHFFILKNAYHDFLDEIYQYVWDEQKGVPVKEHDDVMDSMRYAIYNEHKKGGFVSWT